MILLTGFEPFGGDAYNPSWHAARLAAESLSSQGFPAIAVELPVEFEESANKLREILHSGDFTAVVCVGLAGGSANIALERVAINLDDARIPDNAGASPIDQPIVADGPAAYFSRLPVKAALHALQEAQISSAISHSAGTYVCNHIFYTLMDELGSSPEIRGGFVHVPYATEANDGGNQPALPLEEIARALTIVVLTTLENEADLVVSGGAIY